MPKKTQEPDRCRHPSHDLPNMIVYKPGKHTHTCPGCKRVFEFFVHRDHTL